MRVVITRLLGKSHKYMRKLILKEILIIGEESWGHTWGSPKRVKMVKKTKMAKIQFIKGRSGNGGGSDKTFGEASKIYAERYNYGDYDYQ